MRPHTHALKQGRATPPRVRATRRHADGRKQARTRAYKRHFYTSRPTSRQRQKNTTDGQPRRHSATDGRRATRATTKGHRATTSPANQSGRRHQDAERRQADDTRTPRERHSDTTRTRSHITNGGGYVRAQGRDACSYAHRILYYIYLYLCCYRLVYIYIMRLFIILVYLFIAMYIYAAVCCLYAIIYCVCVRLARDLCIFILFCVYLFIMQSLCKVALSCCLYYIYYTRDTLTP